MYISNLKLKNFKGIEKADLEFDKINIFIARPGQGKSTILNAIVYLLTNYLPERIEEFVHWGKDKFEIDARLKHKNVGMNYQIIGGKTVSKTLRLDIEDGIYKNSDATQKMKSFINPILTLYSSISEQNNSTGILDTSQKAQRLDRFKQILGMTRIENVVEQMKSDIKDLKLQAEGLKAEIKTLSEKEFKFLDEIEVPDNSILEQELIYLQELKNTYEANLKLYEKYCDEVKAYEKYLKTKNSEIENIKKWEEKILQEKNQLKDIKDFDNDRFDKIRQELQETTEEYVQYQDTEKTYSNKQKELEKIKKTIEDNSKKAEAIKIFRLKSSEYTDADLIRIDEEIISCRSGLSVLENKLELALLGKCPTCEQNYNASSTEIKSDIDTVNTTLENLELDKKKIQSVIEDYKEKLNCLESNKKEKKIYQDLIDKDIKQLKILEQWLEKNKYEKIDYEVKLEKLKEEKNKLSISYKEYHQILEANKEIENQIVVLEKSLAVSEGILNSLEELKEPELVEKPLAFDNDKLEEVKKELNIWKQLQEESNRILEFNEKVKKDVIDNKNLIKEKTSALDLLYRNIEIINKSKIILDKDFSSYLIEVGSEHTSKKMNEFFQRAYGNFEITFQQDKKSVDFFYSDGRKLAPVGMASGFEQQCLAVAYRIALDSMQKNGIFSLDEVDNNADVVGSMNLYKNIFMEDFEQLFCITHQPDIQEWLINEYRAKPFYLKNGKVVA